MLRHIFKCSSPCYIQPLLLYVYLVADNDYNDVPGVIIYLNESKSFESVQITVNNDNNLESDEYLIMNLRLLTDTEVVFISTNNIRLTIVDDECEYGL